MNMDYSICNALGYRTEQLKSALIIYDIACQWIIHFKERVEQSKHLMLPEFDEFIAAVDKFHLGDHISACFCPYSLNFVYGAGQVDGVVLETLWSEFNKVSSSARSMSKAHRREVYDDHMAASNWKKLVGMGV
jgi:hypothetical protein